VARLVGVSRRDVGPIRPNQFDPEHPGLFGIAVAHGRAELESLKASRVDYWALGGRHARRTLCESMPVVHDPGSPQGRQPDETGPHGCTLVQVDSRQDVQMTLVPTDVIRWETQRVVLDGESRREALEQEMAQRIESLRQNTPQTDLLVSWQIVGTGALVDQLRHGTLSAELLRQLRDRFGQGPPAAWSAAISVEPPAQYPSEWYEEDSIRGEFLRRVQQHEQDVDQSLGLETFLPKGAADGPVGRLVLNPPEAARDQLLREAAMLGVDLLEGEESES